MLTSELSLAGLNKGFVFATVGAKDIFLPEVLTPTKEQSRSSYSPCAVIPFAYSLFPFYSGSALHLHTCHSTILLAITLLPDFLAVFKLWLQGKP